VCFISLYHVQGPISNHYSQGERQYRRCPVSLLISKDQLSTRSYNIPMASCLTSEWGWRSQGFHRGIPRGSCDFPSAGTVTSQQPLMNSCRSCPLVPGSYEICHTTKSVTPDFKTVTPTLILIVNLTLKLTLAFNSDLNARHNPSLYPKISEVIR
jgi:hypothetical protein